MKKQEISWKKSISSRKMIGNVVEEWLAFVSKVLLDVICALIFTGAARVMLVNVFDWAKLSSQNILKIVFFAVLISIFMELAGYMQKRRGFLLKTGTLVVAIVISIGCILPGEEAKHLLAGLQKMATYYIDDWNNYYGSTFYYAAGRTRYVVEALDFVTMFLFVAFFWMAKMFKKNLLMAALPAFVLVIELMVGYAPEYNGLMLFFIAVVMANSFKWASPDFCAMPERKFVLSKGIQCFSWIWVCVLLFFACGIIKNVAIMPAEKMVANSGNVKMWVQETATKLEEITIEGFSVFGTDEDESCVENESISEDAILTNEEQRYRQNVVLQIEFGKQPVGPVYLKGFCADDYQNGKWSVDIKAFDAACKEAGFSNDKMSKYILSLTTRKLYDAYRVDSLMETEVSNKATIKYLAEESRKVYLPYFIELDYTAVTTKGASLYRKNEKLDEMSFELWDYEGNYRSNMSFSQEGGSSDWEKWYREYVMEHYLEVPDNLPSVVAIAQELEQKLQIDYSIQYKKNEQRLRKADLVIRWMMANTKYSTKLPEIPQGMDPVEYFLGTSRTGYCMHYASASVMILRQMGVPARYASGYIVKPGAVKAFDNGFYANIKDSNAHAWVEIYLDDIGWVPFEVTNGYNRYVIGDEGEEIITNLPQIATAPAVENILSNVNDTTEDSITSEDDMDESDKQKDNGDSGDGADGKSGEDEVMFGLKRVLYIIGGLVLLLVVYGVFRYKMNYRMQLRNALRQKNTLRAINMINRRLYKKLRYTGKIRKSNLRDDEYKNILIETYTDILAMDWERYMDIVKAAAFSKRAFSVEEMEFCYKLYHKIVEEDRKKQPVRRD